MAAHDRRQVESNAMKCPACTREIAEESPSCPSCGADLEDSYAKTRILPDDSKPNSGRSSQPGRKTSTPSRLSGIHSTSDSLDHARFVSGTILNERYRVVGLLGRGGMGEVYRAEDLTLEQPVALKFLPEALSADEAALARFRREVRVARQISHTNVCRVYDIGEAEGMHFLSMEYIRGEELSSVLKRFGRLPSDKATDIARQICAGLAAAHDAGVLHRDLKPANVMIDENGDVRITDFGLAGLVEEFGDGAALEGTPEYMSPEQLSGRELTVKSDVYSLGLVLYEIFTGRKAFSAGTLTEILRLRKTVTMPESLSSIVRDVDPHVERVIERCLASDPKDRPASALQVAAGLPGGDPLAAALAAGETPSPEMVAAAPKHGSLRPAVAVLLLAATLAALALSLFLTNRTALHRVVPLDKSVQGLRERAVEITRKFGYDAAADNDCGFFIQNDYLDYVRKNDSSPHRWDRLKTGRPVAIGFWYRQSPRYLVPFNRQDTTALDPPHTVSGMAGVSLDARGRMLFFYGVPPQVDEHSDAPSPAFDWSQLFAEAGLDMREFTPSEPKWVPPQAYDQRAAWDGHHPGQPDSPIHIEAAAFEGRPVWFQIINPWNRPARQEEASGLTNERAAQAFAIFLFFVILLGAALLARHNLRMGRGDRRGAFRLAAFVFLLEMVSWLFGAHHVPEVNGEFSLFVENLAWTLLLACLMWLVYVALEPFVRRRWPHRIISWNRLLAGGWRDPLVGRDLLLGALFGFGEVLLEYVQTLAPQWLGMGATTPPLIHPATLSGMQYVITILAAQTINALIFPASLMFLLLLFSIILRRERVALALLFVAVVVLSTFSGEHFALDLFFAVVGSVLTFAVLLRFGLLAFVFMQFFALMFFFFPMTTDFSAWYAGAPAFALAVSLTLVLFGFRSSLAGQPLLRGSLVED
ncbi:MAG: eukaryotic-like serine/threonine-protein kinase [Acidobacteriota bacterium]|jgi:serine/threonine-protein kinase|nr:eukaryotic-like serine/threonine-protein kinase [Acidobacteriota bacterium]